MRRSRCLAVCAAAAVVFLATGSRADATPFSLIRIGDVDGFGVNTAGKVRATPAPHTTPADTNSNGLLEVGEFLPDLNHDGAVALNSGDDFDNRSAAEVSDSVVTGSGFTDLGSSGSKWTDVALSQSSTLPNFPDPAGPGLPNEPSFIFNFNVGGGDVDPLSTFFFNVLFGDYDVVPANITLTFASAPTRTLALATQPNAADGLIQAAFATLLFNEVFTADGSGGWNGYLRVDFNAPNEPYTAFDFTELSTAPIQTSPVPEPGSLLLVGSGAVALLRKRVRRHRALRA
jgi:hypothetical protein